MIQSDPTPEWITESHIAEIIQKRNLFSHKGSHGHALLVADSFGKVDAAVLAARACPRVGYMPNQVCVSGAYLHGLAGDVAVQASGEFSFLASDLIENIGKAFLRILSK